MDFAESLFGKVSNWKRAKEQENRGLRYTAGRSNFVHLCFFFSMLNLGKK